VIVRVATVDDAKAIAAVMAVVVGERVHSSITKAWTAEEQREHIAGLDIREAIHVAMEDGCVVGLQTFETLDAADIAQIGTFLFPEARGKGVGRQLFTSTLAFAEANRYREIRAHVRASNRHALGFYRSLGFDDCARIAGVIEDVIVLARAALVRL
jgi:GNAT superfamily N-acetyltransferase